ncbi:MAG: ATP-dependent zinc metalloprotease FtsH [Clostridia bacterium]|nr:ATP-dependent zinc metalloprotease FtsH [Clostridia bacterium]
MKRRSFRVALFYLVIVAIVVVAVSVMLRGGSTSKIPYSQVRSYFLHEQVTVFEVTSSNVLKMTVRVLDENGVPVTTQDVNGKTVEKTEAVEYKLRDLSIFLEDLGPLISTQYENGIIKDYDYPAPVEIPWWVSLLPYLLLIVLFVAFMVVVSNSTGARDSKINSFGKARTRIGSDTKNKIYFKDVAGIDECKEELEEVVEFLRDPGYYERLGAKIPRGVLLVGPPGTGKTLLARAVAGEAGVPFYSISGSDFVEMYVGVGASRVRDLFDQAKKNPASIIFIDEIDAVGRHRGAGLGGGHDEREQTLNQLLVEMDGFVGDEGVVVIAATNRPDILDPALLRPGRFDRQITVDYPDLKGREAILEVHRKGKPFEESVDMHRIAQTTVGFTGADLANLLNEAALMAARKGKSLIGMTDIEDATMKVIVGIRKKRNIKPDELKKTAYHEAGHAILAHVLPTVDPVRMISIIPSGRALGYTLTPPVEDKFSIYKEEMEEEIAELLGGRTAEEIIFGNVSGGASNDIQRATGIARNMVMKLGMSPLLGPILYGNEHGSDEVFLGRDFSSEKNYSDETAKLIDQEIKRIVEEAHAKARRILEEKIDKLHFVAAYLLQHETMDDAQFAAAMEGEPTFEELEAMVAEKKRISDEENEARKRRLEEQEKAREEEHQREEEFRNRFRNNGSGRPPFYGDMTHRPKERPHPEENPEEKPPEVPEDPEDDDNHN